MGGVCWGMPAAFIQPVLYYCNYYDHHRQGHLMATQMNVSGLARRGPTPYATSEHRGDTTLARLNTTAQGRVTRLCTYYGAAMRTGHTAVLAYATCDRTTWGGLTNWLGERSSCTGGLLRWMANHRHADLAKQRIRPACSQP
eukprot:COSAG01_NODE_38826_length_484_cov_6.387013_1_plen_141_part_10